MKLTTTHLALACALSFCASMPAAAVPVSISDSQPDTVVDVQAGDVLWKRVVNASAKLAGPNGPISGAYYRVRDAVIGLPPNNKSDPLDDHLAIAVNGTPFLQTSTVADRIVTAAGTQVNTIDRVNTGGVTTSLDYFFSNTQNAARVLGRFTNDTGSQQTVQVLFGGDLGSDSGTTIEATSSGDTLLQAADDRWLISSDRLGANRDPMQVFSFAGEVGQMADFSVWGNLTGAQWTFDLAAGETRNLMWFNQQHLTLASAQAATGTFTNLASLQAAGLLEGLSNADLAATANWTAAAPVPEPQTYALMLAGLAGLGALARRRVRVS